MAINLADLANVSKSPLEKFVLKNWLRYSDLMSLVPFKKIDVLAPTVARWKTLPTTGNRNVNGAYSESTGNTEQVSEGVYGYGGDILFDRVFDLVGNTIQDPKETQVAMKARALSIAFTNDFINGDHASSVTVFEGLNKRIASYLPARQSISIGTSYDPGASATTINNFVYYMHQLIDLAGLRSAPYLVQKGKATGIKSGAILGNRHFILGFEKLMRGSSNLIDTTQDNYGRFFTTFAGIPLIDVGLKADQSTEIILNTYGAGLNETRVFAVRFAGLEGDDGLNAIQLNTPDPYDPVAAGEVGASSTAGLPAKSLRIDWWVGLAGYGSYYAARLTGLKDPSTWT